MSLLHPFTVVLRAGLQPTFLFCLGICAFMSAPVGASVGEWKSYTPLHHVTCFAGYQGKLYVGTSGGIRERDLATGKERVFDNLQGLLDVWISSLVVTEAGDLWAVSQNGFVQEFVGNGFSPYGRSYAAERWNMSPRAVATGGPYLALGSSKGLTFFDTRTKSAVASLTRFGDQINDSVLAVLRRGDSLYITTPLHAYAAGIDWNNLLSVQKFGSIFDPRIWKRVPFPEEDTSLTAEELEALLPDDDDSTSQAFVRSYNQLVFENGRIQTYPPGMVLPGKVRIEAIASRDFKVNGESFVGIPRGLEAAIHYNGSYFAGGSPVGLLQIFPGEDSLPTGLMPLASPRIFPLDTIINLAVNKGTVYGQSRLLFTEINETDVTTIGAFVTASNEMEVRNLRNLVADSTGALYVGTWGSGMMRLRGKTSHYFTPEHPCLFQVEPQFKFSVIHSISKPFDRGLWLGVFNSETALEHQLAYFDATDESFTCFDNLNNGGRSRFIEVLGPNLLAVGSSTGLFLYRYSTRPASLTLLKTVQSPGDVNDTWGGHLDAFKRLWALQGGKLVYVDSLEKRSERNLQPKTFESFRGTECHVLSQDPAGGMWAGCNNGLFQIIPEANANSTRIQRFSLDDGLVSNLVYDVAVDPTTGYVWAATDRGVSRYEGGIALARTGLAALNVFPNPFRKQHRFVTFDQLPSGSEIRIHSQAGQVVRTFLAKDLRGYQAQWDGTNDAGKPVTAGVYLYTVKSGSEIRRGRVILAR
jgi:FlgD Ig-like domain